MAARQPAGVTDAALRLLARRAYSRHELAGRLSAKGYDRAETDEALARLVGWGYLDDRDVARHALEDCLTRRPRGRELLRQELLARGISDAIVQEVLSSYTRSIEETLAQKALARLGLPWPLKPEDRGRAWRALVRLGFAEPTIERICGVSDP
ncbi:MAG: regulatory protein RecX [Bacteroidota bacterium]